VQLGLLTVLSLPVLLQALQTQPQLLVGNTGGQRLLLGLGGLSALGGALLACGTSTTRRAVAYLAISNMGLIAIGLATTNAAGVAAALLGSLTHVLALALIALGLALLEQPVPGRREQAGLLRERPIAALALVVGVLLLLGLPPLAGWLPKLLLLSGISGGSPLLMGLVAGALALGGLAGARLLRRVLLQPADAPTTRALFSDDLDRLAVVAVPYAPRALQALILALSALALGAGLWPAPFTTLVDAAIRGLPFLSR
jgi:formate hydrogenlyase subunit 3/multisubunit Na+/H+ antiporter MnhD subunit